MARIVALTLFMLTLGAAALLPRFARPLHACSAGPDFNPVAESEVIVAGRILRWERADRAALPPPDGSPFVPIRLTLRVEQTLKGATPAEITVVDGASLMELPNGTFWVGGAGACGSFDDDPNGLYTVIGLGRRPDGSYAASRPLTFYLGERPGGPGYEPRLGQLASFDPTGILAARFGVQPRGCPVATDACAFAMHMQRWLTLHDHDPIVSLLRFEEVVCPGPVPVGLGGPYPLCDGSAPGERRSGALIVRLGSEGGVGDLSYFRTVLARTAPPMRLVGIGCPDAAPDADACRDRFALVYAAPDCPAQGGCPARPVTVVPVSREPSGQLRLTTIITTAAAVVPDAALSGGRTATGHEPLLPGPASAATFAVWSPPAVIALPPSGHGVAADTSAPSLTTVVVIVFAIAVPALLAFSVRRRRGPLRGS